MIYFSNESTDPYFNQAFEEYIFENVSGEDVFLLWKNSPAVVCGCYQNIFAEVNVSEAIKKNIAIVRRISGGGTVFHDLGNINYTFITSGRKEGEEYSAFIKPIVAALNEIGIPAELNRNSDIAVNGLKVSGSAQRMVKGRVMHHGTLLFDSDLKFLTSTANGQSVHYTSKGIKSVPWPVTNMKDYAADKNMTVDEFKERLRQYIVGKGSAAQKLSEGETEQVKRLAEEKYKSWDWTFGRSPAYTFEKQSEIDGEIITAEYSAKKAVIEEISITSDMKVYARLCERLKGQKVVPAEIEKICFEETGNENFYKILF